jgi:colicin import membrane protein
VAKDLSSRIWRTVVFSGAMLGAPLASADTKAPAKPTQARPAPHDPLADLEGANKRIDEATRAIAAARSQAERDAAKAKLEAAKKAKADAEAKLKKLTPIERLELELAAADRRVTAAVDEVVAAQTDADRSAAKAKLEAGRREKADLERRLADEKAKAAAAKRPRTDISDKPVGRGFVLG